MKSLLLVAEGGTDGVERGLKDELFSARHLGMSLLLIHFSSRIAQRGEIQPQPVQ